MLHFIGKTAEYILVTLVVLIYFRVGPGGADMASFIDQVINFAISYDWSSLPDKMKTWI